MDGEQSPGETWQKREWKSWEEYSGEPLDEENEEYIQKLKEDVILYVTFPKPRGYGGAPTINGISAEISESLSILSKWGRMDVLAWVYKKFAAVHSILRPVRFSTWMILPGCFKIIRKFSKLLFWMNGPANMICAGWDRYWQRVRR